MKTAIVYDNAGYFVTGKEVPDNYQLALNETFIIPTSDLLKPRFTGTSWVGMSKEEFEKATINTADISKQPSTQGMIQKLGLVVAQISDTQNKIEQQLAKLTNGGTTNA